MTTSIKKFMDGVFAGVWEVSDFKIDEFVAWSMGSEIVINRNFYPKELKVLTRFKTVQMVYSYKVDTRIEWNGHYFFANSIKKYVEEGFKNMPFEIRMIKANLIYFEFKIDESYSFLFQEIMSLDEDDNIISLPPEEVGDLKILPFDKVFKNITIGNDMEL